MTECIKLVKALVKKPIQYLHIYQSYYFRKAYNGETAGRIRLKVIASGMASMMMNRKLGIILKEGKGNELEVEIDPKHPERYAMPPNLWNMCFQGISWFPPIKK